MYNNIRIKVMSPMRIASNVRFVLKNVPEIHCILLRVNPRKFDLWGFITTYQRTQVVVLSNLL